MIHRRAFLGKVFRLLGGLAAAGAAVLRPIHRARAATGRVVLPRGTRLDTLLDRHPARLDASQLDLTPISRFQTMGDSHVVVDPATWRLTIVDPSGREVKLGYDQILRLPAMTGKALLICPDEFAFVARWTGVSIPTVLRAAGLSPPPGVRIVIQDKPGPLSKVETFTWQEVAGDRVWLAFRVNGRVLPRRHGWPLRAVAPDHYGGKWVKYVHRLRLVARSG